jgi:small basic protein|tara:strand:+ start:409 stop:822 length:414 start_codon:yes stop_codon:yes gene_type:complete
MKTSTIILSTSAVLSFIGSYFLDLTLDNADQFLSIACVVLLDGVFGIMAGIKREGFKTYKALSVLRTVVIWWVLLGVILTVEKSFAGTAWLSETVVVPFLLFQIISALKNASMAGFIKMDLLNKILDKIDKHKGLRN